MNFSSEAWQRNQAVYDAILKQPFNQALMDGSLSRECFSFYIVQDTLYLRDFSRSLALLAAKAADDVQILHFLGLAQDVITEERALHDGHMKEFELDTSAGKSPSCMTYTGMMVSCCALDELPVGLASLLPCFWVYREVGNYILEKASPNNPWQSWIDMYASDEFSKTVDDVIMLIDQLAESASETTRQRMHQLFTDSIKLEYLFWDSAWRLEKWPV